MIRQDDPRLGSLFNNNINGCIKVALIGYPIDLGVIRNGGRPGAAEGPEVIRNFLNKKGCVINSEYGVSLEKIELKDFGNTVMYKNDLKTTHVNHQNLVANAINDGYLPIIIGGGNDQSFPNYMACSKYYKNMLVINIDAHLDVRPLLENDEPHSGSPFRQILESERHHSLDLVEFACQGSQCSSEHVEYVQKNGGKIIWLKELQGSLIDILKKPCNTVQSFQDIINKEYDNIFVSFDIDSIRSSDCPGVSCPSVVGLTGDEALSICYRAGLCKKVQMLDISEFNPLIESYRTGTLIANMIYYFLMGVVHRNIQ